MWKTLLGLFGGGEPSVPAAGEGSKVRAGGKGRGGKRKAGGKRASGKKTKLVVGRAAARSKASSRPRKASVKRRRGARKGMGIWPTEPTKAARRASPAVADDREPKGPDWSQPTEPLL